ncbi:Elongation of very long chain fatty acids protein 4 [Holothuria leucospilota]|uniref:Elongation of very long chain fatty acids protein n=1 Tax=Holothuria leucospilota TaxID=206669 RepID=A0A9Q0YLZ9_HOLLE|nr:Elongation of very long chain fatty acids protein 4 [Holothuria leucospilota]
MGQAAILNFLKTLVGLQSFVLMIFYLIVVGLSPLYIRLSKPFSLRKTLIIYNYGCSLANLYTLVAFIIGIYNANSIFILKSNDWLKHAFFLYWALKNFELLDTLFMILRHKQRQISFLHIYHHGTMVLLTDFGYHYSPWAGIAFLVSINSFVHVCLYFYYAYSAQHPNNPPSWKKNITQLQIAQFLVGIVHAGFGYKYHNFCIYGPIYGLTMIVLFSNYYLRAFVLNKKGEKSKNE